MRFAALKNYQDTYSKVRKKTILSVGPVTKNTVDASIAVANGLKLPIQLSPSRRQIDHNGGYVGWTTQSFAKYVRHTDTHNYIVLSREHGGTWQGEGEDDLSYDQALETAQESFSHDIEAGFDVLHVDPTYHGKRSYQNARTDLTDLLEFCESKGIDDIAYECGTTEKKLAVKPSEFTEYAKFCRSLSDKVKFVVGETGTNVKDTQNVTYDKDVARKLVNICEDNDLWLKEHGVDYASDDILADHVLAGIHGATVAPHFGSIETQTILDFMKNKRLVKERRVFVDVASKSKRWKKWTDSSLSSEQKAVLCGHYILTVPEIEDMLSAMKENHPLDHNIQTNITRCILKYLRFFKWIY